MIVGNKWLYMPSGEQKKRNNPPPSSLNNRTYFAVATARDKMSGMVQDPAGRLRVVASMGLQPGSSRAQRGLGSLWLSRCARTNVLPIISVESHTHLTPMALNPPLHYHQPKSSLLLHAIEFDTPGIPFR